MRSLTEHIAKDGFRLRGTSMSRVDAFSDIVFGFALTLLVVSLEVPKTFAELHHLILGFFPFALAFAFLIMLWLEHYTFFRRFGLEDVGTICLNAVVLFLVLFYVYPLKFLFALTILRPGDPPPFHSPHEILGLMLLYGLGFTSIYWAFAALYLRAWTLRTELGLNPAEAVITRLTLWENLLLGGVGLLSALAALLLPANLVGLAGLLFFLIGVVKSRMGSLRRQRLAAMVATAPSPTT